MPLKAGTKAQYAGSMAQAIEQAFRREWPRLIDGTTLPATTSPEMQLLFIAVAQGVVGYLKKNISSFKVDVTGPGSGYTVTVTLETEGDLHVT
jgi:hypothetical protein